MTVSNMIGADGRSALPSGLDIQDYSAEADNTVLSGEAQAKYEKLIQQLDKEDEKSDLIKSKARFTLEIAFSEKRSMFKPFAGVVVAWSNGGFLHGGGDQAVYFCGQRIARKDGGSRTCATPLDARLITKGVAVCPSCRRASKPADLVGQVIAKSTFQNWVTLVIRMINHLECNADLRMCAIGDDLRKANELEMQKEHRGDLLTKARQARSWTSYPLSRQIKDLTAGSSLESRIRAFLTS